MTGDPRTEAMLREVFASYGARGSFKPTRKQIETTLDVLAWLSAGDLVGPAAKDNIGEIRCLIDNVLEVGW